MSLLEDKIIPLVADEFASLDQLIRSGIDSKVPLMMQVSSHVVSAGGKRMRPLLCLLAAKACCPQQSVNNNIISLAAIVELLHTATLVHDDVVDESSLRRGKPTANATWSNQTAVLVGDFLIARAFDLLVDIGHMSLLKLFSTGTCEIAEGEVLQLQHQHNPNSSEADYLKIIEGKTSKLFAIACEGSAMLTQQSAFELPLRTFALHFGNAFQMIDDILDYSGDVAILGKNIGDDLMEGKPTLPLISALHLTSHEQHALIKRSIQTGGTEDLEQMIELIKSCGALDYCRLRATEESQLAFEALSGLPDSVYKDALKQLTEHALARVN